jgi:hypothetical protein
VTCCVNVRSDYARLSQSELVGEIYGNIIGILLSDYSACIRDILCPVTLLVADVFIYVENQPTRANYASSL